MIPKLVEGDLGWVSVRVADAAINITVKKQSEKIIELLKECEQW